MQGGAGLDRILLPASGYQVKTYSGYCTIAQLQSNGTPSLKPITAYGFELIGSATNPANSFTPSDGSYLIGADGSISKLI